MGGTKQWLPLKGFSVDANVGAVFTIEDERKTALKLFLSVQHCLALLSAGFGKSSAKHCVHCG